MLVLQLPGPSSSAELSCEGGWPSLKHQTLWWYVFIVALSKRMSPLQQLVSAGINTILKLRLLGCQVDPKVFVVQMDTESINTVSKFVCE